MSHDPRSYRVYIEPLSPDLGGGFVGVVPELPGCMSDGDTPGEALMNVYDAILCWIEDAEEVGEPVPAPKAMRQYA